SGLADVVVATAVLVGLLAKLVEVVVPPPMVVDVVQQGMGARTWPREPGWRGQGRGGLTSVHLTSGVPFTLQDCRNYPLPPAIDHRPHGRTRPIRASRQSTDTSA